MRSITGVVATALLGLPILGLAGCSQDNEAFVKAQAEATAGKGDAATKGPALATQADYAKQQQKQQQQTQQNLKSSGYPGAK
jgi:hypothetical protein